MNIFRFSPATHNNHFPQVTREGCDALSAAVAARLALLDAASRAKDQVRNGGVAHLGVGLLNPEVGEVRETWMTWVGNMEF